MIRPARSKGKGNGMRVVELVDAHYRRKDVDYGASFIWESGHIVLECNKCGERQSLKRSELVGGIVKCPCGENSETRLYQEQVAEVLAADNRKRHPWRYWEGSKVRLPV